MWTEAARGVMFWLFALVAVASFAIIGDELTALARSIRVPLP